MVSRLLPALGLCATAMTATAETLPISAFAADPQTLQPAISPDGRYLSIISTIGGRRVALVRDLKAGTPYVPVITAQKNVNASLSWCKWANNTRLVCSFHGGNSLREFGYSRSYSGSAAKLSAVDADGKNFIEMDGTSKKYRISFEDRVLDWTPSDPENIFVATVGQRNLGIGEFYVGRGWGVGKLNIYTGELVDSNDDLHDSWSAARIGGFFGDRAGNFPFALGLVGDVNTFFAKLDGEKKWRALENVPKSNDSADDLWPLAVDRASSRAYVLGLNGGRAAVLAIDLTDRVRPTILFEHPTADIDRAVYVDNNFVGVQYEVDRPFIHYVDDAFATINRAVNKALPARVNNIISATADRKTVVIDSYADIDPGSYYLFDVASGKMALIGKINPNLKSDQLGRMRAIEYPAQDGTMIPGYLIEPPGQRAANSPLIVMPNPGRRRQSWGFHLLGEFLASRGYTVLLPNSRGAEGYGLAWSKAAKRDWGGLPQADATDGARWAVATGLADPKRICVLGAGYYGGYIALAAGMKNGDVFRCVSTINALADMDEEVNEIRNYRNARSIKGRSEFVSPTALRESAPLRNAEKFTIPVQLVYLTFGKVIGTTSPEEMAAALKKEKKPHELVQFEGLSYAYWSEVELVKILTEVERFLAANIGK